MNGGMQSLVHYKLKQSDAFAELVTAKDCDNDYSHKFFAERSGASGVHATHNLHI